jgi:hypothetical protein
MFFIEGICLRLRSRLGYRRIVRLWLRAAPHQDKGEKDSANEQKEKQPTGRLLKEFRPNLPQIHLDSFGCCRPSARTMRTFHLLSGARLLRPPWLLPVIAKNAGVVDFGGIMPEASAMDCV